MHIKPFKAAYPDFRFIASVDGFFSTVKEDYTKYKQSGFFQKASQAAFYIYEIQRKNRKHTGLIALAHIKDYLDGLIKIHENTLPAKEQQQTQMLLAREAQVKPVLITCKDVFELQKTLNENKLKDKLFYSTTFESSGEVHTLWEISDSSTIQKVTTIVDKKVPEVFIADGHHRSSTMARLYEKNLDLNPNPYSHLLVALFPKNQLEVHDFNRLVQGLRADALSSFVADISQLCNITPLDKGRKPEKKHQMTMFINREWYLLEWRSSLLEKHKEDSVLLDADLLDQYVFEKILGIKDVRLDARLKYVEGPAGVEGLQAKVLKNENRIGFCLYPIELDDLMSVAKRNGIMPPKSTWFEPRIKNGLAVLDLIIPR